VNLALLLRDGIPSRQRVGPRGELRILGNNAHLFLSSEGLFAILVPPHVELALELVDPLLGNLVRGVGRAGCKVKEEWPLRRDRLGRSSRANRMVGKIGRQVIG